WSQQNCEYQNPKYNILGSLKLRRCHTYPSHQYRQNEYASYGAFLVLGAGYVDGYLQPWLTPLISATTAVVAVVIASFLAAMASSNNSCLCSEKYSHFCASCSALKSAC